jgi:hypothetical protein
MKLNRQHPNAPNKLRLGWKDGVILFFMWTTLLLSLLLLQKSNQDSISVTNMSPSEVGSTPRIYSSVSESKERSDKIKATTHMDNVDGSLAGDRNNLQGIRRNNENNDHSYSNQDGWVNLQVFAGRADLLHKRARAKWHSQVKQDEIIAALLKDKREGYFVDLAAHDAVHFSNTLALEKQLGWTGKHLSP